MTAKQLAEELKISIKDLISKCQELGYDIKSEDDVLDDDLIVMLDSIAEPEAEEIDAEVIEKYEEEEELEERVEEILETKLGNEFNTDDRPKKKNPAKKDNKDFLKKKKEIYKNKTKLQSNKSEENKNVILYKNNMTVGDLAELLNVNSTELIKKLMTMGMMITVNQSIDFDTATLIALEYNKELKNESTKDISNFEEYEIIDEEKDLKERPAVVTIMGHVDHGKTSLLDYIRESNVIGGEAGGITQHIGAYQVVKNDKKITFIDTPGHAAFTEMRARGASITDIVIIIVAADDGVMPQTKEAVDHAKAAGVPIIVAINKIDKPNVNVDKIMSEMSELGLTPEEWGGDTIFVKVSAHSGEGIPLLLDNLLALAEIEELKANPNRYAIGTVIEARLDKTVGSIATLLIQNGTLRLGDPLVVGSSFGKVRTLKNSNGVDIVEADPSMPVEVTGLNEVPVAGDKFMSFESEKEARSVAEKRTILEKDKKMSKKAVSLEDLFDSIKEGKKEINIVLKADVKGSEEAVKNTLEKVEVEGVKVQIIRSSVGTITESDIVLANASNAIVIGFNVIPTSKTKDIAKEYDVEIRLYNIIYKLVEEIEAAMKGLLDPEFEEVVTGEAEVRKLYKFSKVGIIAGTHVLSGIIKNNSEARVVRDGIVIYDGKIGSLQREKDQAKEVKKGFDCGITMENYSDLKEKDIIQTYEMKEIKK